MSTGDHLTVRDYFDRVLGGKQRAKKIYPQSPQKTNASRSGTFQGMLASHQTQGVKNIKGKSAGLTIVDYLANPIRRIGKRPSPPALSCSEITAKGTSSSHSERKRVSLQPQSAAKPSGEKPDTLERQKIERSIQKAARKYDLSPRFIKGVIRAESNFQVDAVSRAGALGLMQLMPATAKELGVSNPLDIDQNIDGGCRYLRKMLNCFGGDAKLALAAYNSGPGTVRRYAGKVPYPETIQYVDRVMRFSEQSA